MGHVVVIGAGQAGAALVARLRGDGFDGAITLIGQERVPPYQRPPLSKDYLLGEMELERLFLRPAGFYADHGIDLRLATRAGAIDRAARTVTLADGEVLHYDKLALTTGAVPRRLPAAIGGHLPGVLVMRDLADADALAPLLREGARVAVIGGGYIGLEAAAVCAQKGMRVTLIEAADRILQRVAAPATSDWFRTLHRAHGVDIREGTGVTRIEGSARAEAVLLGDGTRIDADLVIVGVGVAPDTALAQSAGLVIDNGIATDEFTRTSDPDIHAAGDCASLVFNGERIRIEAVSNAIDMGEAAARNIMGRATPYRPAPWFWSDQYDVHLQIAGLGGGHDAVHVRQDGSGRSHWYFAGDRLIAVDAMNDARAYMLGKRLIEAGRSPAPEVVCDPATDLKALLRG
ncbi:MAG: FAD-dependent oxidoreductase [Rubellimicrobium sp.]|nr:FAD-dependent oxidoreductase [Rubellimicrobium sp.]